MVVVLVLFLVVCTSLEVCDGNLPLGKRRLVSAFGIITARDGSGRGNGEDRKGSENVQELHRAGRGEEGGDG